MPNETHKILAVDDDPDIRAVIEAILGDEGFEVVSRSTGGAALDYLNSRSPDLMLLDILLPDIDGREVLRSIRETSDVPIVIVSRRSDAMDRVAGLELGADDYIAKPFEPRELVARVGAVLRRSQMPPRGSHRSRVYCGELVLDVDAHSATWGERQIDLTKTEFDILHTLVEEPGRVFSRDMIVQLSYEDQTVVSGRTIDSHVRRIRQKFAAHDCHPIETIHGIGFRLAPEACDEKISS